MTGTDDWLATVAVCSIVWPRIVLTTAYAPHSDMTAAIHARLGREAHQSVAKMSRVRHNKSLISNFKLIFLRGLNGGVVVSKSE